MEQLGTINYHGFGIQGYDVINASKSASELSRVGNSFDSVLKAAMEKNSVTAPVEKSLDANPQNSGITGDYIQKGESPFGSAPVGMAANSGNGNPDHNKKVEIDRNSKLYKSALELESYIVKIMLNSMRNTLNSSLSMDNSYASKVYKDMLYDQLATTMTENAGFGLADQVYLQLK